MNIRSTVHDKIKEIIDGEITQEEIECAVQTAFERLDWESLLQDALADAITSIVEDELPDAIDEIIEEVTQ